jgi:hypothetical protein
MIKPAVKCLIPENKNAGKLETPMSMARYVVPQTMQMVNNAR